MVGAAEEVVRLWGFDKEARGDETYEDLVAERNEAEARLAKLERKADEWSTKHAVSAVPRGHSHAVSETAGMSHHQRRAYLEAKRLEEAEEADLLAFGKEKARKGNPALGIPGREESDPFFLSAASKYAEVERKRRAETPPVAAVAAVAVGGAGTGSDAPRWGRKMSVSSAAPPSAAPPASCPSNPPLPAALDTLLKTLPVCYKSLGGGRFAIELHRQKLRALSVSEGRDVPSKEVEEILRAEVSSLCCAVEEGSWGTLCVLRI
jgi:hypothetical protein